MKFDKNKLPYTLEDLPRESKQFYISSSDKEIAEMLKEVGLNSLPELYNSIPSEVKMERKNTLAPLSYDKNLQDIERTANKNDIKPSFIGDSLRSYSLAKIMPYVCALRGLTTAYTPYQPERSQGTLWSLWYYSNIIAKITGFEAINASLYDRSTALFEAALTARKISKHKGERFLVSRSIHPNDIEVLETLAKHTSLNIDYVSIDKETGATNLAELKELITTGKYYGVAFSQTNCIGLIENFDEITNIALKNQVKTVCDIDLIEINKSGLKKPSEFGDQQKGVDIIIGEGQHLAIGPNFGGPGLGIFGVRYNKDQKLNIRSTPGRYIGKTVDVNGDQALCIVLATREQHIRREKATSNICSNQSFLASIVGASLLERGSSGLEAIQQTARDNLNYFSTRLSEVKNLSYIFPSSNALTQIPLAIESDKKASEIISEGAKRGLHIGTDISDRFNFLPNALLISFNDLVSIKDIDQLIEFLKLSLGENEAQSSNSLTFNIPESQTSKNHFNIKAIALNDLKSFYLKLSKLNVSPDDNIYPLGSCTMKYNPYINDYNASLTKFTNAHPQAPTEDVQGCLEVLYKIQERFKCITGLPAVTTQPVAGAQGELVGIKMFQAYHESKNEIRDIILIPKSAHGTNPATATMAGIQTYTKENIKHGIIAIDADSNGQINIEQLKEIISTYGKRIIGVMVTNPNTSGIFENNFKLMAELIHEIDALVYMDGANMNAIAGIVDLNKLGVDAVHNNLHKTWTIPHGGGGPGDAIVAVSNRLKDYLPGIQVSLDNNGDYQLEKSSKTIGSFHRNFGNFAHKVRCLSYLNALGDPGVIKMSSVAVLSSCYLFNKLKNEFPTLPSNAEHINRMHEFIITLPDETFKVLANAKIVKSQAIGKLGKLFLDFGVHAPTVSFPEPFGLMIEPTESFTKSELDKFYEVLIAIKKLINNNPEVLQTVPHFTPVKKVNEVQANKDLVISDNEFNLPKLCTDDISPEDLSNLVPNDVCEFIVKKHHKIIK
jgi:glycine dehydrogenase